MPSISQVHISQPLTNFALTYKHPSFLGYELCKSVPVKFETDSYYIFGSANEEITPENTVRADGAPSNEIRFSTSSSTYACVEHSLKHFITDRRKRNSDSIMKLEMRATNLLQKKLELAKEIRIAAMYQSTTYAGAGDSSPSVKWDNTSAVVDTDIDTAKKAVFDACGYEANSLVINYETAMAIVKRIKLQMATDVNIKDYLDFYELPPELFGLKLYIGKGKKNTVNPGQTSVKTDIWTDAASVCYLDPNPGMETLTFAVTFQSQNYVSTSWRVPELKGDYSEISVVEVEKPVCTSCMYLLTNVLT